MIAPRAKPRGGVIGIAPRWGLMEDLYIRNHYLGFIMAILSTIMGCVFASIVMILSVYFIMPFPGSQHAETIDIGYTLHVWYWYLIIPFLMLAVFGYVKLYLDHASWIKKTLLILPFLLPGALYYLTSNVMSADSMFLQPRSISHIPVSNSSLDQSMIVIGTEINGEAKAYPMNIVGYHHQIRDSIGGVPVMITYCTVCRTGRIWDPIIDGTNEAFRLVGMDHFNAMFEDKTTGSWWRQATGEAVTGPRKGMTLKEYPIYQKSLKEWKRRFPKSVVMLPDMSFSKDYDGLSGYDKGIIQSKLVGTSQDSWKEKSWVIGIRIGKVTKAYDWNFTKNKRFIADNVNGTPIIVNILSDNATFNVWNRTIDSIIINPRSIGNDQFYDDGSQTLWDKTGRCIDGILLGKRLEAIPAYQEFWHSWRTFNPNTLTYGKGQ